jgi:hypothetical protein
MKDLVNIQDFLVESTEVGDWEGEEEFIADRMNELLHYCWSLIPADMTVENIEQALAGVWDNLRGGSILLDVDMAELEDWVVTYMHSLEHNDNERFD